MGQEAEAGDALVDGRRAGGGEEAVLVLSVFARGEATKRLRGCFAGAGADAEGKEEIQSRLTREAMRWGEGQGRSEKTELLWTQASVGSQFTWYVLGLALEWTANVRTG